MNYYYCLDGINVVGPYPKGKLQSLMQIGAIPETAQVCAEGTASWEPISSLREQPQVVPPTLPVIEGGSSPLTNKTVALSETSDSATPRQRAFLTYMGVRGVERMTMQQASTAIDDLDNVSDQEQLERNQRRCSEWRIDRFVICPELYAAKLKDFLREEFPQLLHTYVRGQVVGSSERLTKQIIHNVIKQLAAEDRHWWHNPQRKEIFFERLRQTHPGCCDGRPPEKAAKGMTSQRASTTKGSGCLLMLAAPVLVCVAHHLLA